VPGLARTRLKRVTSRANVNGGFSRLVTLRNLDLSEPDHTDWHAFSSLHCEMPVLVRVAQIVEYHVEAVVTLDFVIANDEGHPKKVIW
jgi:hypothetical protein